MSLFCSKQGGKKADRTTCRGLCFCHPPKQKLEGLRPRAVITAAVTGKTKQPEAAAQEFPLEHFFSGHMLKIWMTGPPSIPQLGALPCEKPPTRSWSPILSFSIWISCSGLLSRALVMALWAVMRVAVFRSFTAITDSTGSQMRNWTSAPTDSTAPSLEASCFRRP